MLFYKRCLVFAAVVLSLCFDILCSTEEKQLATKRQAETRRELDLLIRRSVRSVNSNSSTSKVNGSSNITDNRKPIFIGLLLPFSFETHRSYYDGGALFYAEAFLLALEAVNNDPTLLPGYRLDYVYNDTKCTELNNIRAMYYQYQLRDRQNLPVHGFIGLGCECSTAAKFASAMKVPVVSHMCANVELSNKQIYPTFARTYPMTKFVVPTLKALLNLFNWTTVALIYPKDSGPHKETKDTLIRDLKSYISHKYEIPTNTFEPRNHEETLKETIAEVKKIARIVILYVKYQIAREVLMHAHRLGMNNGDYVFIVVELTKTDLVDKLDKPYKWFTSSFSSSFDTDHLIEDMFKKYTLVLGPSRGSEQNRAKYGKYTNELKKRSSRPPFNSTYYAVRPRLRVPLTNVYLYDAVRVLALAMNKTLNQNKSIADGMAVAENIKRLQYQSIDGSNMTMNDDGDAQGHYSLYTYQYIDDKGKKIMIVTPVGEFSQIKIKNETAKGKLVYRKIRAIPWENGKRPLDQPPCGFKNEKCPGKKKNPKSNLHIVVAISVSTTVIGVILLLLPIFMYRQYRLERELTSKLWKVSVADLAFINRNSNSRSTLSLSQTSLNSADSDTCLMPTLKPEDDFMNNLESRTVIAVFKGTYVAVKEKRRKAVELNREVLLELKQMRDIRHDNINQFIGASVESDRVLIVTQYALRGSLDDVLLDSSIKLETLFLLSLIYDIVKGMSYLHSSEIKSHGNLKSSNCVIDSRWVLKITDFGLQSLRGKQSNTHMNENRDGSSKKYLWRAPELLRMQNAPPRGTEKGDVYSLAIILQECHTRQGPWSGNCLAPKEILTRVIAGELPPFRPTVSELIENAEGLRDIMKKCWLEHPDVRPSFPDLCKEIEAMMKANGLKRNIVDNMIYMMERYTDHLEDLVEQKTGELLSEKKKIESLLERMLPASVAKQLKLGKEVEAETFKHVSIYFSDIVGFTELCAESSPMQVVKLLNDLYTLFDNIIKGYSVYKVETIGDAYMVVSGLPIRNEREHASEIALMALHINSSIKSFKIHHRPDASLQLRIGINSGAVVAGVVGTTMPRYCLFGDTVNTASRMESTGAASKIHISEATKDALEIVGGFDVQKRGTTYCKGKGEILTYWLNDAADVHRRRISAHDEHMKCQNAKIGSQLSLTIFRHSPTARNKLGHPSGLLKGSPEGTPIVLRKAMFLKNMKDKEKVVQSFDIPDPDVVPLLHRTTDGPNGVIT